MKNKVLILILLIVTGYVVVFAIKNNYRQSTNSLSANPTQNPGNISSQTGPLPPTKQLTYNQLVWDTYVNKSLGISIKYPKNYVYVSAASDRVYFGIGPSSDIMEIQKINTTDDLNTWWQKNKQTYSDVFLDPVVTTVNNYSALFLRENTAQVQVPSDIYVLKANNGIYLLSPISEIAQNLYPTAYPSQQYYTSYQDAHTNYINFYKKITDKMLGSFALLR